jgi:glycine/D-amino acid oxidase-like deaminating enzyme
MADNAKIDYLVIGQGVAGTMLSHFLLKENKRIFVADLEHHSSSSRVAAGVFNPITGMRLVKTWKVETLFPFAKKTYLELEELLKQKFYHEKNTYRLFSSIAEQNDWAFKRSSANAGQYMEDRADDKTYTSQLANEFGGFEIRGSGYVDIEALVSAYRDYLGTKELLLPGKFKYEELEIQNGKVHWNSITAKKIIFCEGYGAVNNPYFSYLPLAPVKGELLTIHSKDLQIETIINKGIYIIPLGDHRFRVGATYDFNNINEETTETGRREIETKLKALLKVPYTIEDHRAGIRPATKDRRPFLGFHPLHPELAIFNGLGTKGISLAPYFAHHLTQVLEHAAQLDPETDIRRFR